MMSTLFAQVQGKISFVFQMMCQKSQKLNSLYIIGENSLFRVKIIQLA